MERLPATAPRAFDDDGDAAVDHVLLGRIQRRDEDALAALYDRHAPTLFALALRLLRDQSLAQEVLQDTFLRCWNEALRYDPARGRVARWLSTLTRNRSIDVLRSRPHQARLRERDDIDFIPAGREPTSADPAERVVARQWIRTALEALPASQRDALVLSYYGGLSQTEIAAKLDTPLGTIKTRMRRGIEQLRDLLEPPKAAPDAGGSHGS